MHVDTHARYEFSLGRLLYEFVALVGGGVFLAIVALKAVSAAPLSAAVIGLVALIPFGYLRMAWKGPSEVFGTSDSIVMLTRQGQKRIWKESELECRPTTFQERFTASRVIHERGGAEAFRIFRQGQGYRAILARLGCEESG